ncbi:MAG TPA: ribbon-helix-helix domain-containing protein [Thermoanaerobaculia bacterium]|nr:ribbon-helix-helix domain-containing protein [Thermoanaerobaculia bacterium]
MKPISVHVSEPTYEELKELAGRQERPVAELIRDAMSLYLEQARGFGRSLLELDPADAGRQLEEFSRAELYEELLAP